jgi:sugar phosphate isomerase/epimerase
VPEGETNVIAIQLYTVRSLAATDMLGTIRKIGKVGYKAVEFAGYGNSNPKEIRPVLDESGIKAVSAHVPVADFESRLDGVIDDLTTLGCEHAVVPWLPPERRTLEEFQTLVPKFNTWAARCKEAGLRFGYHNHDFEFTKTDSGQTIWELLTQETDPSLVNFQVDVGWVEYTSNSAVDAINKLKGRVPLLHMKELSLDKETPDPPFGEGAVDWPPVIAASREAGTEWYIAEQDRPNDPIVDATTSLRNLEKALG